MAFSGEWSLPLFTSTGEFDDGGSHGYAGDFTLPMFAAEGVWGLYSNAFTGDFRLPLWDLQGSYLGQGIYVGDFRLPRFFNDGEIAAGGEFRGALVLPMFVNTGVFGNFRYTGSWVLPLFTMAGRFEQSITTAFKAWVANLKHGALTEYTNYPFNSFARFNGEYLGAGADGIFALDGDDDAGTKIAARVRFGLMDMDIDELKRVEEAFISYRSEGQLILRLVIEDGQTYEYRLEPTGRTGMYQARVKTGKGLKMNYICIEIGNFEGAEFDLDKVRIRPIALSRMVG